MKTFRSFSGSVCIVAGLWLSLGVRDAEAGSALAFDGVNDRVSMGAGWFPNITNSFTIEMWANPTAARSPTAEGTNGYPGIGGQRYAIFPEFGAGAYGSDSHAGAGISIGTNGASVFEHSGAYLPSPLVYTGSLAGWTHFAVTYSNGLPRLYVGGNLVRIGLISGRIVHPSQDLGESDRGFGYFQGMLDEVRVWSVALNPATLQNWLGREVNSSHPAYGNLIGYWRLNEGRGTNSVDSSVPGHHAALLNGTAWATPGAPIIGLNDPIVITDPASDLADTSARLQGAVNPQGNATTAWFEWGSSTNFEFITPPQAVGAMDAFLSVSNLLTGLAPVHTFYFRLAASNSMGVARATGREFRTRGQPEVTTLGVLTLSTNSVSLQGAVTPNGHATWAWFEWGMTTNYGTSTPPQSAGSGLNSLVLTQAVAGLLGGQEYHYRIVATNASGSATGLDQWFATAWLSNTFILQPFRGGGIYWGDFDNSSRLDLLGLPNGTTNSAPVLWLNWTSTFNPQITALPLGGSGVGVVGDLNKDGLNDLVWGADYWFQGYLNDGAGFPTRRPNPLNFYHGLESGALGDFDNDGDLDLVMTGHDWGGSGYVPVTGLYRNDGGQFTSLTTTLPPVLNGAVAWGDYDNDGQLDVLIAGETSTGRVAQVYHNNNGVFTDVGAGLRGVNYSSVAWGDSDGDGWLDALLCGTTNGSPDGAIALIYHNNHDGTFTDIVAKLPGALHGTAAWGDFDNDGSLDVLLVGVPLGSDDRSPQTAVVYRNDHGRFTDAGAGLPQYPTGYTGRAAGGWGDYDGDGRLDVAFSWGVWWDQTQNSPSIYRNWLATTNTLPDPPNAPPGLAASVGFNMVTLQWNAASDPHTLAPGLTYNVRIGAKPGGAELLSPGSDPVTGKRYLPQMGNAQHRLFITLTNVPLGRYYWSVQAVNHSFVGSPWASEQIFANLQRPSVLDVALQTAPATPGAFLRFGGSPGSDCIVETSTNLMDWLALTNLAAGPDGLFDYFDTSATNFPTRFYRLRVP